MREYFTELKENWRDDYWRADHPELQLALTVIAFLLLSICRTGFTFLELLMKRRLA